MLIQDFADDNSFETIAIRRAFMTSTCSVKHRPPGSDQSDLWTYEQILEWIANSIDLALKDDNRYHGARCLWREWSVIECHVPRQVQTRIVQSIDTKISAIGFPTLRELVGT